jgi:hypothetical protein
MVLSVKEGPGSNVSNGCCWVSKEDVCGDDYVRVVSAISISTYYPYLLSVPVDGSGVNPRASICFNASAKTVAVIRDPLVLLIYLQAVGCRRFPVSGAVVAYFLLLSSFTLLALFQMIAVGQLDSVRSAKNAQPI